MTGLALTPRGASGLVETMREIGCAVGVAAVRRSSSPRAGEIAGAADPASRGLAAADAFHTAFWVMFVVAALGAVTAAIAVPRRERKTQSSSRRTLRSSQRRPIS